MPKSCFAQGLSNQRGSKTIKWEIFYINEAAQLFEKIVKNLVDKIADQSQTGTLVDYTWFSDFNFNNPINIEKPIEYLKELHAIYCVPFNHTVPQKND